jgi:hypothetical protein
MIENPAPLNEGFSGSSNSSVSSSSWRTWFTKVVIPSNATDIGALSINGSNANATVNIGSHTVVAGGFNVGSFVGQNATISIAPVPPLTVAGSATFTRGILTSYTPPS